MPNVYDLLIKNARTVTGTGSPYFRGDVGIQGDKIVDIGALDHRVAQTIIDVGDLILSPGFIDLHTHADQAIESLPLMENYLRQGVTTVMGGNCGYSAYPIDAHLHAVEQLPLAINYGTYIGHGTIRQAAMGLSMRGPSENELMKMREITSIGLEQGAFGMSLGLYYAPGSFAELPEVVALASEVSKMGGLVPIHIRDESDYGMGLVQAVYEAVAIAREANCRVQISHLKCLGRSVWGKAQEILQFVESARGEGLDIAFDQYPYTASGTSLTGAIIPRWAQAGGEEALAVRLQDQAVRPKIREEMLKNIERRGGAAMLVVALFTPDPILNGKTLDEVGEFMGLDPVDAAIDMQIRGGAKLVSFNMSDEDLAKIMSNPLGMVASDGSLVPMGEGVPHPRYYGTFPRVLGKYVREQGVLTLEEAIRKMTSAPAARLGLWNRGLIAPGFTADLVLFNPHTITDKATFNSPHNYSTGIELVIVQGQIALDRGSVTASPAGRILRKTKGEVATRAQ